MIKVIATHPIIRSDREGYTLDVGSVRFAENPNAVYEIPETPYWTAMIVSGDLVLAQEKPPVSAPVRIKKAK